MLLFGNVAWFAWYRKTTDNTIDHRSLQYPLLSQSVFFDRPNDKILNFVSLRNDLQTKFNTLTVQKSFYFQYLPTGTSIKIGADNELIAASLIKVPLVMNLYKAAELGKINLNKTVVITQSEVDSGFGDLWRQGAGTQITLQQAAQQAIINSDDTAAHAIFDNINGLLTGDQQSLNQLDVNQNVVNGQAVIDAKSYTSILNSLYLASYLTPQDSETLLHYLTESTATSRLVAELPKGVAVAHKIGVYNATWSESDCGIVYVPKRPYAICIMVGLPEDQANSFIAAISKEVYSYVTSQ